MINSCWLALLLSINFQLFSGLTTSFHRFITFSHHSFSLLAVITVAEGPQIISTFPTSTPTQPLHLAPFFFWILQIFAM